MTKCKKCEGTDKNYYGECECAYDFNEEFEKRLTKEGDTYCYTCDIIKINGETEYLKFYGTKNEMRNISKVVSLFTKIF